MVRRSRYYLITTLVLLLVVFPITYGLWVSSGEWSGTSNNRYLLRGTTNQSPATEDAIVQVFVARSARWRGVVSVHSWIALRARGEEKYTRLEVIGWNKEGSYVIQSSGGQDDYWYGYRPNKIFQIVGDEAERMIEEIKAEISKYPYHHEYRAWPGPNSNTFVSYIARQIPELAIDLPPTAIGKDYVPGFHLMPAPSSTGCQLGKGGNDGLMLAAEEG